MKKNVIRRNNASFRKLVGVLAEMYSYCHYLQVAIMLIHRPASERHFLHKCVEY